VSTTRAITLGELNQHPAAQHAMTKNAPTLTARALKCTLTLQPSEIAAILTPPDVPRIAIKIEVAGRVLQVSLAAKSVRRAAATIGEHGAENCACVLQGKLVGNAIEEAGLSCMPKTVKAEAV
jgi:hypothetical protein